jgi:hypothetical protein
MTDEAGLARLARQYSMEAIATLVFAIRNSTDLKLKVTAALALLDRGFGRPAQAKLPTPEYSLEDIDRMIAYLERQIPGLSDTIEPETLPTSHGDAVPDAGEPPPAIRIAEAVPAASEGHRRAVRRAD